jgi:hypothetical protein
MWLDAAIAVVDVLLSFSIWPMVWRIYRTRTATSQSYGTSIPTALLLIVVGTLFWLKGMYLVSIAHLPVIIGWTTIVILTRRYR